MLDMNPLYKIRAAAFSDAEAIRAIRNRAISHGTALWTTQTQSSSQAAAWLGVHLERGSGFVAEADGEVAGFAVYGPWRASDGYRHTVEDSIYVREDRHGLGIGSALLGTLIGAARDAGHHVMIADIESGNAASIRLHERHGFERAGTIPQVGTKFGTWLDLTILHLPLAIPG